jgi:hypothetical protein
MLRHMFAFSIDIPSRTFMHISKSSNPYKYVFTTPINCKDRCFYIVRDIRYQKVILFITGVYVSLKSMPGLCVNPCEISFALHLTTSLFSFCFWIKTHLNPTGWILGGVGITLLNTSLFLVRQVMPRLPPI